jgi:Mn-dependent DtxR family transcriptional regulator
MINQYTIKFGPAVSQNELEKALSEGIDAPHIHKLKARIELVLDYKDLRTIDEFIKHTRKMDSEENKAINGAI